MTALMLSALLLQAPQLDANQSGWVGVQALPASAAIRITMNGGDVEGTFIAANPEQLVIHLKRGNFSVDKANIKRLDLRSAESNRGRNIDRGVEIGFLIGAVRSRFACRDCGPFSMLPLANSMAIGMLVGATASATKWETIYTRTK